jgi:basic endochitinase B
MRFLSVVAVGSLGLWTGCFQSKVVDTTPGQSSVAVGSSSFLSSSAIFQSSAQLSSSSFGGVSSSSVFVPGTLSVDSLVTLDVWSKLFPYRYGKGPDGCKGDGTDFFTQAAFVAAAKKFPLFVGEGTDEQRKKELAAFFANISHETTGGGGDGTWCGGLDRLTSPCFKMGLCYREEIGCESQTACIQYGKAPNGTTYHGRGPMQLSHSYNYEAAGLALTRGLALDPSILVKDAQASFESAIWFWMTEQAPKPSCHAVMVHGEDGAIGPDVDPLRPTGFGLTINIINGGRECGTNERNDSQRDRMGYYRRYLSVFGLDTSGVTDCAKTPSY